MAKISLRSYIHEIEGLIDKGQTEEAVAHCRYILQSFPKLLAAYRLMGKALLETRQYTDAADIFQRVLSSTPDDFVSQVGMSIIREDEGNMDAAIWHMERAFEVQPYNVSLQDELRRLYGRRDGVEPPKVRLTRGALARMYAKGNLYQQAIAELRAGLMEDTTRVDLQVVLARMYFQSRQRVEAVDTCSALIKKFPYCLEANRILSIILPETGRKEDTQVYRQRVLALDPYLVHADSEAVNSDAVPENLAMLERLDYQMPAAAGSSSQPAWAASLGVNLNEFTPKKEEEVPDWLASIQQKVAADTRSPELPAPLSLPAETQNTPSPFVPEKSSFQQPVSPSSRLEENIDQPVVPEPVEPVEPSSAFGQDQDAGLPEWMKEAGWVSGTGEAENEPVGNLFDADNQPAQTGGEIAKAELPDWLKAIAPEGALETGSVPSIGESRSEESIPSGESPLPVESDLPDWLNELSPAGAPEESAGSPEPPTPAQSETELPSWLQEIPATEAATDKPAGVVSQEPAQSADEIPDWLHEIGEDKTSAPDTGAPLEEKTTIWEEEKPVEIPVSAPLEENVPGINLEDQDAALAWLESLAAKQGVSEEELITNPVERQETPPSWVQEVIPGEQKTEEPVAAEAGLETFISREVVETPSTFEPTIPEVPAEAPFESIDSELPDWLKEMSAGSPAGGPVEEEKPVEAAPEPEELPDWLLSMEAGQATPTEEKAQKIEEPAQATVIEIPPAAPVEIEPQTVTVWDEQGSVEIPVSSPLEESVPGVNLEDQDAAMAWLESLAAKQGAAEEELTTRPEERLETPPTWVEAITGEGISTGQPAEAETQAKIQPEPPAEARVPAEAVEEEATTVKTEPAAPVSGVELPDWLQEMSMEEAPVMPAPVEQADVSALPDWLQEISLEEEPPSQVEAESRGEPAVEPVKEQPAEAEIQPPAILSDEEAAIAWLESLAAKQGVPEEELTTRPEERPEAPPAWVQEQPSAKEQPSGMEQPAVSEMPAVEKPSTILEQPAPVELEAAPGPSQAVQRPEEIEPVLVQEQPALPKEPVVEEQPSVENLPATVEIEAPTPEAAPLPDWLQEMAAAAETPTAPEEAVAETQETAEAPVQEPQEAMPPLPAWLENASEEVAVEPAEIAAAPLVNINNASLVELENLPGLGFILAQAIITHREQHGPFSRIDDLVAVQGFNPGIVAEISDKITAAQPTAPSAQVSPETKELEGIEHYEAELMKARNAMVAGEVDSTLTHYGHLIKKEQLLAEVIRDLHEALYRYPVDANIWTALGDAYMHNNQLQEALDSYVKAEELIR